MGSRYLKGLAIHGTQAVPLFDPATGDRLNNEINRRLAKIDAEKPELLQCSRLGTARATSRFASQGNLPIKNFQLGSFPSGVENFQSASYLRDLNPQAWPCKYCVIRCHNRCEVKEGPYRYKGKGPEYESMAMMGLNTLVDDLRAVAYAAQMADEYSLDTISLGAVLAWAMESYEKGVITKRDTDGLDLRWGNAEAMVEMVRKIGERAGGLGYLLGEGTQIASTVLGKGSEAWAVQMKGQELRPTAFGLNIYRR